MVLLGWCWVVVTQALLLLLQESDSKAFMTSFDIDIERDCPIPSHTGTELTFAPGTGLIADAFDTIICEPPATTLCNWASLPYSL